MALGERCGIAHQREVGAPQQGDRARMVLYTFCEGES
jgi:hypothetical protein